MAEDLNLDDLVVVEGEPFDESKSLMVSNGTEVIDALESMITTEDNNGIIPGEKPKMTMADDITMTKEEAENALFETIAYDKLQKEKEMYNKLSDESKLKDFLIQNEVQRFFARNGFQMNGKQRRMTKREIERKWKAGKFKKWVETHGDDVLYELNKASNTMTDANKAPNNNDQKQPITSLNSLISTSLK